VVVKGTRGNEGAERSGVHDEEQWTKDRALGDTAGGRFHFHVTTLPFSSYSNFGWPG